MGYKMESFLHKDMDSNMDNDLAKADSYFEKEGLYSYLMRNAEDSWNTADTLPIPPDPYCYEFIVVKTFITDEMKEYFPIIARDFLTSDYKSLSSYEEVLCYMDITDGEDSPEDKFNCFILSMMVNAVKKGSENTKLLFISLEKSFYKKEYKSLKRFQSISAKELINIACPEDKNDEEKLITNIGRIMFMTTVLGIKLNNDCGFLYILMRQAIVENNKNRFWFRDKLKEKYRANYDLVLERYNMKKMYSLESLYSKYLRNIFKWLGYDPEYAELCLQNKLGTEEQLATALTILKETYPDKEIDEKELMFFKALFYVATSLTSISDWVMSTVKTLAYGDDSKKDKPYIFSVIGNKEKKMLLINSYNLWFHQKQL